MAAKVPCKPHIGCLFWRLILFLCHIILRKAGATISSGFVDITVFGWELSPAISTALKCLNGRNDTTENHLSGISDSEDFYPEKMPGGGGRRLKRFSARGRLSSVGLNSSGGRCFAGYSCGDHTGVAGSADGRSNGIESNASLYKDLNSFALPDNLRQTAFIRTVKSTVRPSILRTVIYKRSSAFEYNQEGTAGKLTTTVWAKLGRWILISCFHLKALDDIRFCQLPAEGD